MFYVLANFPATKKLQTFLKLSQNSKAVRFFPFENVGIKFGTQLPIKYT